MSSASTPPLDPIAEQQAKLARARWQVQKLQVMAMRPDQPPDQVELLRNLERSARAEVKLRLKALAFLKAQAGGSTS